MYESKKKIVVHVLVLEKYGPVFIKKKMTENIQRNASVKVCTQTAN